MDTNHNFLLPVRQLSCGNHLFEFALDDSFFENLEQNEIFGGDVHAKVEIKKTSQNIAMSISAEGDVVVMCDRCLDNMTLTMEACDDFTIVFGETYAEDGDNIVVVPEQEGEFDVAWLIYETILLALPFNHTH
ncbi:MAG: DUF177 domain-containing protein, partial [Bacteroidales bacterium]|nr:DUF177 domain-containing protein [Bacteroidales bacterium]